MNQEGKLLMEKRVRNEHNVVLYVCTPAFLQHSRVQAKKYPDGRRDMAGDTRIKTIVPVRENNLPYHCTQILKRQLESREREER